VKDKKTPLAEQAQIEGIDIVFRSYRGDSYMDTYPTVIGNLARSLTLNLLNSSGATITKSGKFKVNAYPTECDYPRRVVRDEEGFVVRVNTKTGEERVFKNHYHHLDNAEGRWELKYVYDELRAQHYSDVNRNWLDKHSRVKVRL